MSDHMTIIKINVDKNEESTLIIITQNHVMDEIRKRFLWLAIIQYTAYTAILYCIAIIILHDLGLPILSDWQNCLTAIK